MSLDQVRNFLAELREVIGGSGVDLVPRRDTLETLRFLGLTKRNLEDILEDLSTADYCSGPEPDRDRPGEIWVFGKNVDGYEVYIKLKVTDAGTCKIAKCISFHIASHPLNYPYR